ncbi:MAG: type II secretion system F family protein [Sterolibacterium sp.]|jgi:type IV pilus assembly protein PilC|nr:type II secretion system F family protein [Sterolibacterium sp.]
MPLYHYRAADQDGRIVKGAVEALHESDLEAQLKNLGLSLMRAKVIKSHHRSVKNLPPREVINFLFQLEMQVRGGVPIRTALTDMRDDAESPESRNLAAGLTEKIESGATLAEAINAYPGIFSEVVRNLIRAGEVSGQLPEVLSEIVRSLKWQDEIAAETKKLLLYPSFVVVVISGVVFFLMIYLVPQLVGFLTNMGQEVPLQTRALIWLSNLFVHYWWAILTTPVIIVLGVATAARSNPKLQFRLHQALLNLPFIGSVLKKIILARFADTFALMYRTGIPMLEGLGYCQQVSGNLVIQQAIARARERIANGEAISASFAAENMFPNLVIRMLKVGEATGALDLALNNINYFYSRDIEESIGKVQAMIEPAMTVIMGLILGWIMLAVLSPIYDTISKMKT